MVENSAGFRKSKEKRWNIWPPPRTGTGGAAARLMPSECARGRSELGAVRLPLILQSADAEREAIKIQLAHLDPGPKEGNQSK